MPELLSGVQNLPESIFAYMSRLALQHNAINLGQGFPSNTPPNFLLEAAQQAMQTTNQYAPPAGLPALRAAVSDDMQVAPERVVVTTGASEGLQILAFCLYGAGDEVIIIEPAYDIYTPQAHLSGAQPVGVSLRAEGGQWLLDVAALERAISPRTRAIVVNNPHNPTGAILPPQTLQQVVELARQHDLWLVADEVYDELFFETTPTPLSQLAPERTFTVGSAGKRLEATGWRVGWIIAPELLTSKNMQILASLCGIRQQLSFCAPAPLQAAVASALVVARQTDFYGQLRQEYVKRRQLLQSGLEALGATVYKPEGSYFLMAQRADWQAEQLVSQRGVATIPAEAFVQLTDRAALGSGMLRFAFCKSVAELEETLTRLA